MRSLKEGDLSTPNGILDCTAAAHQLQRCVRADIHKGENVCVLMSVCVLIMVSVFLSLLTSMS